MPCQSKFSTLIGARGQDLRTARTPSEKCSDSMSSSWRCRQGQGVSAGQLAGCVKQLCTIEDCTQYICNILGLSCRAGLEALARQQLEELAKQSRDCQLSGELQPTLQPADGVQTHVRVTCMLHRSRLMQLTGVRVEGSPTTPSAPSSSEPSSLLPCGWLWVPAARRAASSSGSGV